MTIEFYFWVKYLFKNSLSLINMIEKQLHHQGSGLTRPAVCRGVK